MFYLRADNLEQGTIGWNCQYESLGTCNMEGMMKTIKQVC